jgi:hypothetical protein
MSCFTPIQVTKLYFCTARNLPYWEVYSIIVLKVVDIVMDYGLDSCGSIPSRSKTLPLSTATRLALGTIQPSHMYWGSFPGVKVTGA